MTRYLNLRRSGHGPTLVLVHGVAGSGAIWDAVMPTLNRHFKVIRVDLLGYGYSPKPWRAQYTPEEHLLALRAALKHHRVKPPFAIAGLSMGALLVLEYLHRWPEEITRAICIGLPYYRTPAEAQRQLRDSLWVRLALERPILGRLAISGGWGISRHNRRLSQLFAPDIYSSKIAYESTLCTYRAFKRTLLRCMIHNPAGALLNASTTKPTLFIHGGEDRWSSLARLQKALQKRPQTQLQIVPKTGHNTVVLEPEQTARFMVQFAGLSHRQP